MTKNTHAMTQNQSADVLFHNEIESYIENLQFFPLDQIGTIRWFNQHEMLEKLNQQALCETKLHKEEVVSDRFLFFEKATLLVEILIAQNVWMDKVFPAVGGYLTRATQTFPTYMVLFHAVTTASLLETLTYSESFCQALDESVLDLLDFCHDCIGREIAGSVRMQTAVATNALQKKPFSIENLTSAVEQLNSQRDDIAVILGTKAVGILCHLIQHASSLSLSATTRMCDHHDMPVFLCGLLESNPWTRQDGAGCVRKFVDGEWRQVAAEDRFLLTRTEGQLWIALHQSLLNPDLQKKYHLNSFRKNRLMRLTALMSEMLVDQLPILADLQKYLHTLGFIDTPMPKKGIIIEQAPLILDKVLAGRNNTWDELARRHAILSGDEHLLKVIAGRLASIYSTDAMDQILPESAKCASCGHPTKNRCSGCKAEWYCRRECQVKQWPKHKASCIKMAQEGVRACRPSDTGL